jgi:hypothetical protein
MKQLISAHTFINKLTGAQLSTRQVNRACAYLRAKKVCFLDTWSNDHVIILNDCPQNKPLVMQAIAKALA